MKMFFESSQAAWDSKYESYYRYTKQLLGKLSEDKSLSAFDAFVKRFDISCGLQIAFTDERDKRRAEATRDCYQLMLKISDLWFSFEHLIRVADDVIERQGKATFDPYDDQTLSKIGFLTVSQTCNDLLYTRVLHKSRWRQELYGSLLPYLKNNTRGHTKTTIAEVHDTVKAKNPLQTRHVLALAYGLRNIYAHEGVSAALGGKNYEAKRELYRVVYDALALYSIALSTHYAEQKLLKY